MRSPVLMIIVYVILSLFVDYIIYGTLKKHSKKTHYCYWFTTILLWILLIVALSITAKGDESVLLAKMWCLFTWLTFFSVKFLYAIFSLIGKIPRFWNGKTIKLGLWVGLPLGIILFILLWVGAFSTRRQIQVIKAEVISNKIPSSFHGYTIAQISDLHLGTWGSDTTFVSNLVDSINNLHPDLIVFTGDIVNRHTPEAYPFIPVLKRLNAPDGVYAILGNHDYGMYYKWKSPEEEAANMVKLKKVFKTIGWKLLCNEHTFIHQHNDSIALIGVENWGEPPFNEVGNLKKAASNVYKSSKHDTLSLYSKDFKILLTHNPEHWRRKVRNESNIDLTLSGHTHGMQMEMKIGSKRISPAFIRYPLWGGMYYYQQDNTKQSLPERLYVNIGAGCVGLPFRLGTSIPEITLFTLYPDARQSENIKNEKLVK